MPHRWQRYPGYDSDPGADFAVYSLPRVGGTDTHLERAIPYHEEPPSSCLEECEADPKCHGLVTFRGTCYFRGGSIESPQQGPGR